MKPNVVLVLVDDMGYGDFGVFSEGACRTPVLDGLVKDGVCLTQHYSGSCVCAPSRGALLKGRYPPLAPVQSILWRGAGWIDWG